MREYHYKDLSAEFNYRIDDSGDFLVEENSGPEYGNRLHHYLREYSPVYSITRNNGRKNLCAAIILAAIAAIAVTGGSVLVGYFKMPAVFLLFSGVPFLIGLAVWNLFLLIRNRGCYVWFKSMFRTNAAIRIVLPYDADPAKSEFIRELQRVIARQFLVRRPELNNPAVAKDLGDDFRRLQEDGVITEAELATLNKRVFGSTVVRNNIGFGQYE